jgi:hypothetical protein
MAQPHPLQDLYDRAIHFKIETFWEGGFEVALVDPASGYMAGGNAKTFDEAVQWLVEHAEKHLADVHGNASASSPEAFTHSSSVRLRDLERHILAVRDM